jgi:hypothetical protein
VLGLVFGVTAVTSVMLWRKKGHNESFNHTSDTTKSPFPKGRFRGIF